MLILVIRAGEDNHILFHVQALNLVVLLLLLLSVVICTLMQGTRHNSTDVQDARRPRFVIMATKGKCGAEYAFDYYDINLIDMTAFETNR